MRRIISSFFAAMLLFSVPAYACDTCSIYTPLQARELVANHGSAALSISQFGYSKTRLDGKEYAPGANQNLKSNVAELQLGYDMTSRFGIQANVPFVNQKYKRISGTGFNSDDETGLGDAALYARLSLIQSSRNQNLFVLQAVGGVKFPTGETDNLKEIQNPTTPAMGIYGSDITLGTGSYDFPVGLALRGAASDVTYGGSAQYILRSEGDENFTYGNDLRWDAWLGKMIHVSPDNTLEPRIRVSGITHEQDSSLDIDLENSGLTVIYVGPEVVLSFANDFAIALRGDFPVSYENDGIQTLADHRVRLELSTGL